MNVIIVVDYVMLHQPRYLIYMIVMVMVTIVEKVVTIGNLVDVTIVRVLKEGHRNLIVVDIVMEIMCVVVI